mgnify:CR=1 FL=1|tara:strand:- start:191 stop:526 length:336 start_codon:yes stop_codon:yes gene_type:complete
MPLRIKTMTSRKEKLENYMNQFKEGSVDITINPDGSTIRQPIEDKVDTAINLDRKQLPDFLNTNIGYKVHVKYDHGGVGVKLIPPMTENQMFEYMRENYPEAFIYRVEYLR